MMNGDGNIHWFVCFNVLREFRRIKNKGEDTFPVDAGGGIPEQILTLVVYVASPGGPAGRDKGGE